MVSSHDPHDQIGSGNAWYTDDQFDKQYIRPGPRAVIENRWKLFERMIGAHLNSRAAERVVEPARILDAGCGDGINLLGLSNMIQSNGWHATIHGADYNELRIGRAARLPFVAEVQVASLDALPYPDDWFEVILCNQVLEHIPADRDVLIELRRVLSPGGILILGVPNEGCALARLRNHVLQRSILRTTDHVNFYTQETLANRLGSTGFATHEIVHAGFFTPHLALHYVVSYSAFGRGLLRGMGRMFSSQCAELIAIAKKKLVAGDEI